MQKIAAQFRPVQRPSVQGAERLWDPNRLLFNGSRVFYCLGVKAAGL